jgi:hypothetical protein
VRWPWWTEHAGLTVHQSADRAADDGFTREAGRDVHAVLRHLPVPATYSSNMFRLTGAATDAVALD